VGHQIEVGRHGMDVVLQDLVHAGQVSAELFLPVPDVDFPPFLQSVFGQNVAGIRVDDYFPDLLHGDEGIQDPPEKGLARENPEILTGDPLAMGLHGQEGDDVLFGHGEGLCGLVNLVPSLDPTGTGRGNQGDIQPIS
jgi:hypothetical protein